MTTLRTIAFCIFSVLALTAYTNGAEAMVTAPNGGDGVITVDAVMTAGTQHEITYENGTPGSTVTVKVHDGMGGDAEYVQITLDANGSGTGVWTAQQWSSGGAVFDAPDAQSATALIL